MYRSVCQALMGAVGRCGNLWVVGRTAFFCGHSICQGAVQTTTKKEKTASLESLYVFCFVVFVSLSDTHFLVHQTQWVSWMGSEFKTVMWSTKEVPCTFSWKWQPVNFHCVCPGYFNVSGSICSMHFNYLSSLVLDKTDVGNELQTFTLSLIWFSETGGSTFDILLYFVIAADEEKDHNYNINCVSCMWCLPDCAPN